MMAYRPKPKRSRATLPSNAKLYDRYLRQRDEKIARSKTKSQPSAKRREPR